MLLNPKVVQGESLAYQDMPNATCFDSLKLLEDLIVNEEIFIARSYSTVQLLQKARIDPQEKIATKLQKWFTVDCGLKSPSFRLILEEYPVFLPSDTEHWVIWINPDIQDSNQAQTIVDQALENIHLQFEITSDDYIIWHRRGRNGTAPMAIHYHIYVRSGFLKEI